MDVTHSLVNQYLEENFCLENKHCTTQDVHLLNQWSCHLQEMLCECRDYMHSNDPQVLVAACHSTIQAG